MLFFAPDYILNKVCLLQTKKSNNYNIISQKFYPHFNLNEPIVGSQQLQTFK